MLNTNNPQNRYQIKKKNIDHFVPVTEVQESTYFKFYKPTNNFTKYWKLFMIMREQIEMYPFQVSLKFIQR